jgi:hypothetical protein
MEATDARKLIELHINAINAFDAALLGMAQNDSAAALGGLQSGFQNILKAIVVIAERFDKEDDER